MPVDMEGISAGSIAIIRDVRLPRVLLGFLTGAALAVCGASYQGIFKNPMADPYILGISSGAALGAAHRYCPSFFGKHRRTFRHCVSGVCGSLADRVSGIFHLQDRQKSPHRQSDFIGNRGQPEPFGLYVPDYAVSSAEYGPDYVLDQGSLNGKGWNQIFTILPYVILGVILLMTSARELDIMLLGEDTAVQLGVNVEFVKKKVLIVSSIVTAAVVSATGIIGFVGLLVPHVVRLFTGPKHRVLMPVSLLFGGTFLILCDTAARSMITQEIPVGIITAAFGGPFFLYLLWKSRRGGAAG